MTDLRIILFFSVFVVLSPAKLFCQTSSQSICWSEDVKLTWDDFQAKPDTSTLFNGMLAATSALIKTFYHLDSGIPNYRVSHTFQKNVSWSRDTSALLLLHEKLHFDLSEVYARRIRKGIEVLRGQKIMDVTKYVDLINTELSERRNRQRQYDKGTHHGAIEILQKEWTARIKKELDVLKKFATKPTDCIDTAQK